MAKRVTWLGKATDKTDRHLIPSLSAELRLVFPAAGSIAVYDCFGGYSRDQQRKVVLGVEVCSRHSYNTHVVKIGSRSGVEEDYLGWTKCLLRHNVASRIFVSLEKRDLPDDRMAIIYQNAYRLFGSVEEAHGPQTVETVAFWAVHDDKPDPISVERVIRQIYTDLHRWFYTFPRITLSPALRFYRRRLRRAIGKWSSENWRLDLRRDMIWMLCGHDIPDSLEHIAYLDPCEYVGWALKAEKIPQTLIGRSHGDLHGRNILVGVQRGEAEYPAVFDYGEMTASNVIAWDFVKLECELKVRLLLPLYEDVEARNTLLGMESRDVALHNAPEIGRQPTATMDPRSLRAHQLAFAFRFESVLAALTSRIHNLADPESPEPPGGRHITGNRKLDRAIAILLRIRQEAALFLGERQPQRGKRGLWRDEYYFALATYGVSSAKFDYKQVESAFALVSSGVAVAQMAQARAEIESQILYRKTLVPDKRRRIQYPYPSYRVPLARAHLSWRKDHTEDGMRRAMERLRFAQRTFSYAVPLVQEYVLLLAEQGKYEEALHMLDPLEEICIGFHDEETLCRIGRLCKELGDRALSDSPVAPARLNGHSAWQWYQAALARYREAFHISEDNNYYPGVNAATLALFVGDRPESRRIAAKVLKICRAQDLSMFPLEECFWILVTQGEADLLLGRSEKAVTSYHEALSIVSDDRVGMVQTAYNQVCRLAWALGETVQPAWTLFHSSSYTLKPGPLGDGQQTAVQARGKKRARNKGR